MKYVKMHQVHSFLKIATKSGELAPRQEVFLALASSAQIQEAAFAVNLVHEVKDLSAGTIQPACMPGIKMVRGHCILIFRWYSLTIRSFFTRDLFQVEKEGGIPMNAKIIHKPKVESNMLDGLARELPTIIAEVMQVPGGHLAMLQPAQVSLEFVEASLRDIGSDIRIMVFARSNDPRTSTENDRAKVILGKTTAFIAKSNQEYSVDIRLYLMEIGAAEHSARA